MRSSAPPVMSFDERVESCYQTVTKSLADLLKEFNDQHKRYADKALVTYTIPLLPAYIQLSTELTRLEKDIYSLQHEINLLHNLMGDAKNELQTFKYMQSQMPEESKQQRTPVEAFQKTIPPLQKKFIAQEKKWLRTIAGYQRRLIELAAPLAAFLKQPAEEIDALQEQIKHLRLQLADEFKQRNDERAQHQLQINRLLERNLSVALKIQKIEQRLEDQSLDYLQAKAAMAGLEIQLNQQKQANQQLKQQAENLRSQSRQLEEDKKELQDKDPQAVANLTITQVSLKTIIDQYDQNKGWRRKWVPFCRETHTIADLRTLLKNAARKNADEKISGKDILAILHNRDQRTPWLRRSNVISAYSFFNAKRTNQEFSHYIKKEEKHNSATDKALAELAMAFKPVV